MALPNKTGGAGGSGSGSGNGPPPSSSLHVSGWPASSGEEALSPEVSRDALLKVFQPFGDIDTIAIKKDYAFVNFTRRADAVEAKFRLSPPHGGTGPLLPGTQIHLVMQFAKVRMNGFVLRLFWLNVTTVVRAVLVSLMMCFPLILTRFLYLIHSCSGAQQPASAAAVPPARQAPPQQPCLSAVRRLLWVPPGTARVGRSEPERPP